MAEPMCSSNTMIRNFFVYYKKNIIQVLLALSVLGGLFFVGARDSTYPELAKLASMEGYFDTYAPYFETLAQKKGAVYAFEVLKRAPFPPNIDLHLLGHVVGDELYKQKGAAGIADCTEDFRNACSHTIVIGVLQDFGEGALPKIREACKSAPGGTGAYTMCYHGFGHGVFAYLSYDLPQTISFCKKTGTVSYNEREYIECVGGAIMELIGGGGHDREVWLVARDTYLNPNDPLYPCNAPFMPRIVRSQCYQYLTPHLFETAGADMGRPTPKNFEDAFRFCDAITSSDKKNRSSCFGGFGKEFVVLAQNRDIRKIEEMTNVQLAKVVDWCELAHDEQGTLDCDNQALQSLFWGGENKPDASLRFCNVVLEGKRRENCFSELTGAVSFYISDMAYRTSLCDTYPELYRNTCQLKLLNNDIE